MIAKFHISRCLLFAFQCLVFGISSYYQAFGQDSFTNDRQTLQISGHYSVINEHTTPLETNNFHFVALTASDGWSITATNDNNLKDYGLMRYDGTNIYRLGTDVGNAPPGLKNALQSYGFIFPGSFYLPDNQDSTHFFLPWMVFHLTPQMLQHFEHNGVIQMPCPWANFRFSLLNHGDKCMLQLFDDNQIIKHMDIVRDSGLDLKTDEDELRRSILDYPFEISARNEVLEMLQMRKGIPDGFVLFSYDCTEVYHTNEVSFPSAVQFSMFWPDYKKGEGSITNFEYTLKVDRVELLNNINMPDLIPSAKTRVSDYRYQATNSRTKYNYASYILLIPAQ
ncbi:MAG TPA: hypothetical protein VIK35_01500 [Verrucomicrobiae bacterium]